MKNINHDKINERIKLLTEYLINLISTKQQRESFNTELNNKIKNQENQIIKLQDNNKNTELLTKNKSNLLTYNKNKKDKLYL